MVTAGLILLIVVALAFDFTNGFHDAANAVAVSITTRALAPVTALVMAAALNVVGALISTKVAATVGDGIIAPPTGTEGLVIVFSALIGAIVMTRSIMGVGATRRLSAVRWSVARQVGAARWLVSAIRR